VRLVHGLGYLNGPEQCLIQRNGSIPQLCLQSFDRQILHHQVFHIPVPAHIVDGAHMRMIQTRKSRGFSLEARTQSRFFDQALSKDFDCHDARQPRVASAVNVAHSARPDQVEDLIPAEAGERRRRVHACLSILAFLITFSKIGFKQKCKGAAQGSLKAPTERERNDSNKSIHRKRSSVGTNLSFAVRGFGGR
jgi:hypothetical protein